MNLESIIPIALAFFIVTVSPGPANIAVATVAMSSGRRNGLFFGLGLSIGLAFWGIIAATGLGIVLQASEVALFFLKILGGGYLLWLAYQSARLAIKPVGKILKAQNNGRWFYRGLILNLSNPKAVVAWMAALSMGLGGESSISHVFFATSICILLGFLNYAGYALAFSLSGMMSVYQRFRRWVDGLVAGLFAIAGLGLIKSAFTR